MTWTRADVDAEAAADIDPAAIPDADKGPVYRAALQLAIKAKHFDKAAKYAKLFEATTPPPPPPTRPLIAQALYLGGDFAGAAALAQKNIDAATAAGKKPTRNDLDVVMAAQVKQKDEAGAEKTLETLVANYNDPDDWNQIIGVALTTKGMRDIDYVYMGRLMLLQARQGLGRPTPSLIGSTASTTRPLWRCVQAEKLGGTGFPPADAKAEPTRRPCRPDRGRRQAERPVQCQDWPKRSMAMACSAKPKIWRRAGQDQGRRRRSDRARHGARHGAGRPGQICRRRHDLRRHQPAQCRQRARGPVVDLFRQVQGESRHAAAQ